LDYKNRIEKLKERRKEKKERSVWRTQEEEE
jgi:hypothetical protein